MSPRNILFLLGFGLHLSFIRILAFATPSEGNTILKNALEIVFAYFHINDGINVLQ